MAGTRYFFKESDNWRAWELVRTRMAMSLGRMGRGGAESEEREAEERSARIWEVVRGRISESRFEELE